MGRNAFSQDVFHSVINFVSVTFVCPTKTKGILKFFLTLDNTIIIENTKPCSHAHRCH